MLPGTIAIHLKAEYAPMLLTKRKLDLRTIVYRLAIAASFVFLFGVVCKLW